MSGMLAPHKALVFIAGLALSAAAKPDVQRLVFEQQKIEGKIRRPQLVLIKADQRPVFTPMVIQSIGKGGNPVDFVDPAVIEKTPYDRVFEFDDTRIRNYQP